MKELYPKQSLLIEDKWPCTIVIGLPGLLNVERVSPEELWTF